MAATKKPAAKKAPAKKVAAKKAPAKKLRDLKAVKKVTGGSKPAGGWDLWGKKAG